MFAYAFVVGELCSASGGLFRIRGGQDSRLFHVGKCQPIIVLVTAFDRIDRIESVQETDRARDSAIVH